MRFISARRQGMPKTAYGLLSLIRHIVLADPEHYNQRVIRMASACGTQCCVAGHVGALVMPNEHDTGALWDKAAVVLGLKGEQEHDLFGGEQAGWRMGRVVEHAQQGATHIANFQHANAKQLKATKLADTIPLAERIV